MRLAVLILQSGAVSKYKIETAEKILLSTAIKDKIVSVRCTLPLKLYWINIMNDLKALIIRINLINLKTLQFLKISRVGMLASKSLLPPFYIIEFVFSFFKLYYEIYKEHKSNNVTT